MITIDIAFDLICPWCLIGKRQLDIARAEFARRYPEIEVRCQWIGVQLLPDLPVSGTPFQAFYENRLGGAAAVAARQWQVRAAATTVGLDFRFDRIRTMPNTQRAHALLAYASRHCAASEFEMLLDRLFAAHFMHGEDIGDVDTLRVIAEDWGLNALAVRDLLANPLALKEAPPGTAQSGVPHFVFNSRCVMTGAHPAETLLDGMVSALTYQRLDGSGITVCSNPVAELAATPFIALAEDQH